MAVLCSNGHDNPLGEPACMYCRAELPQTVQPPFAPWPGVLPWSKHPPAGSAEAWAQVRAAQQPPPPAEVPRDTATVVAACAALVVALFVVFLLVSELTAG